MFAAYSSCGTCGGCSGRENLPNVLPSGTACASWPVNSVLSFRGSLHQNGVETVVLFVHKSSLCPVG